MKYFLLFFLLSSSLYADDRPYLKITSVPNYPGPAQGVKRTINISVSPQYPEDLIFDEIFNELSQISENPLSNVFPLHVRFIVFEAKKDSRTVEVTYTKASTKENEKLRNQWDHVFKLAREIANEQLNP